MESHRWKTFLPPGTTVGRWTILKELELRDTLSSSHRRCRCLCECGREKEVAFLSLWHRRSLSCGCLTKQRQRDRAEIIPKGTKYGYWTVIRRITPFRGRMIECECKCGTVKIIEIKSLKNGKSKSCGCYNKEVQRDRCLTFPIGFKFGFWTVAEERPKNRQGSRWRNKTLLCMCECGIRKDVDFSLLKAGHSRSCGCKNLNHRSHSKGEDELKSFIVNVTSGPVIQGTRVLEGKEIDIFLPKVKIGIEFNGNFWHSTAMKIDSKYHFSKRLLAEERGIRLIQIRSDEWRDKRPTVESLLKAILGKSEHRHFARKLEVRNVVGLQQAQNFLKNNHLMGEFRSARHLGLFTSEGELMQLFSYQLKKNQTIMDCSRICSLRNHSIVGGVSRLLKNALRKHPSVEKVVSFVDLRYADGHSLEKIGFKRVGVTLGWGWTDGTDWFNRLKCKAISEKGITEKEHAVLKGWYRIYDAGQAKYEMAHTLRHNLLLYNSNLINNHHLKQYGLEHF